MRIYRVVKEQYATDAFSGIGALLNEGRWHREGTCVVYASDQPASALLEVLVHTQATRLLDQKYVLFCLDIDPERHVLRLQRGEYPDGWRGMTWNRAAQFVGTVWAEKGNSVVLEVPSVIVPYQNNYLINPRHRQFGELVVSRPEPFAIDPRLAHHSDS